jgi:cyclopropane fatty-acyl-phospholipid synthase-like methyltransferase
MAVINSSTRYAATSEQQKRLQRNISAQAESARVQVELQDVRNRQAALDKLATINAVTDEVALTNIIEAFMAMVDRAMVPILPDDIVNWDV